MRALRSQIFIFLMFLVLFLKEITFELKKTIFQKNICIVEVDLDGFDRDGIGKLEDLLRLELINEEYWNPKAVVYGGKRAGNINQKKKLDVLETCMYPLCGKCYR